MSTFPINVLGGQLGIILGDNPAGHCFVLTNLVPMRFLKSLLSY